jgi:predicted transcriptional regulator
MILTLDIPDALADQLRAAADARGEDLNNYAVAKLEQVVAEAAKETEETDSETDLMDALRQGIADEDAGRVLTLEQVDARVRATLARHNAEKAASPSQSFAG